MIAEVPRRVEVVGTGISAAGVDETVEVILHPGEVGVRVAVCNVHSVMSARRDPQLHHALATADLATADGTPLVWALRGMGIHDQERVDGLRLFRRTVERGLPGGCRHFFYGSTEETLQALVARLRQQFPTVRVAGSLAPPFRNQTTDELAADVRTIIDSQPDVVWVGLGMPRQELWMAEAATHFPGVALVGVGAVFDWVAGDVPKAPPWMQRAGLEWLYRLAREPRRLWQRYAWNNPAFLVLLAAQLTGLRLRGR